MKIKTLVLESRLYLYEGLTLQEQKSVKLWENAGRKLFEAKLSQEQINQIFKSVEQGLTAAGGNRSLIGRGVDVAKSVNTAWEDLKTKAQNSGPIKNMDAAYDAAAEKLKQATGGDQGVMRYVQMYRDFAKKHPVAQSLIYSALIAAAGISGAGLGGAAALGLFKMVDKLLQGEKFSSAAYSGTKTGAMAYGAGQLGQSLRGTDTPDLNYAADASTGAAPDAPDVSTYTVQKGDTLSQIAQKNGISVKELMQANPDITNPNQIMSGQSINLPGVSGAPTYDGGVGLGGSTSSVPTAATPVDTSDYPVAGGAEGGDYTPPAKEIGKALDPGQAPLGADGQPMKAVPMDEPVTPGSASDRSYQQAAPLGADGQPMRQVPMDEPVTPGSASDGSYKQAAPLGSDGQPMRQVPMDEPVTPGSASDGSYKQAAPLGADGQPMRQVPMDEPAVADAGASSAPTLTIDSGNTGSVTLPSGENVPATVFPEGGMQPRLPLSAKPIELKLGDQEVKGWLYGNKIYVPNFKGSLSESKKLTKQQIHTIFESIEESILTEGVLDSIKSSVGKLAGKATDWAKTKAQNITTKITADKLMQAWKSAGSKTDSEDVKKVLLGAGVPQAIIDSTFSKMGIGATPAAKPAAAQAAAPAAKPAAAQAAAPSAKPAAQAAAPSAKPAAQAAQAAQPAQLPGFLQSKLKGRTDAAPAAASSGENAQLAAAVKAAKAKPGFQQTAQDKLTIKRGAEKGITESKRAMATKKVDVAPVIGEDIKRLLKNAGLQYSK